MQHAISLADINDTTEKGKVRQFSHRSHGLLFIMSEVLNHHHRGPNAAGIQISKLPVQ